MKLLAAIILLLTALHLVAADPAPITLTIPAEATLGLRALVERENAAATAAATPEKPAALITPADYLQRRLTELLASYDAAEIERVKKANEEFFALAAKLPPDEQDKVRAAVLEAARQHGILPTE